QQKGEEEGFNSDAPISGLVCGGFDNDHPPVCDDKTDQPFEHALLTAEIPQITIGGHTYREFFLDINEPGVYPKNLLTLDQVEVYVSSSDTLGTHDASGLGSLGSATKVFDLDAGQTPPGKNDNFINLNYSLVGGGSGSGDMKMLVLDDGAFN